MDFKICIILRVRDNNMNKVEHELEPQRYQMQEKSKDMIDMEAKEEEPKEYNIDTKLDSYTYMSQGYIEFQRSGQ